MILVLALYAYPGQRNCYIRLRKKLSERFLPVSSAGKLPANNFCRFKLQLVGSGWVYKAKTGMTRELPGHEEFEYVFKIFCNVCEQNGNAIHPTSS